MALARNIADLSPLVVQGTKVKAVIYAVDWSINRRSSHPGQIALNYADCHSEEDALMHIALWNSAFIQRSLLIMIIMLHLS